MASFTLTDEEASVLGIRFSQKFANPQDTPYPVAERLIAGAQDLEAGRLFTTNWQVRRHSEPQRITSDFPAITYSGQAQFVPGSYGTFYVVQPILMSRKRDDEMSGKGQLIDYQEAAIKDVMMHLRSNLQQQALFGDVTAFADMATINGTDYNTGFVEHRASGSQTNTVHGLSKSTYATLLGTQNQFYDCSSAASAHIQRGLAQIGSRLRRIHGNRDLKNTFCYASEKFDEFARRIVIPQRQYLPGGSQDIGVGQAAAVIDGFKYDNVLLPSAGATSAANKWSFLGVDHGSIKLKKRSKAFFTMTPYMQLNPLVSVSVVIVAGQLVCEVSSDGQYGPLSGCFLLTNAEVF